MEKTIKPILKSIISPAIIDGYNVPNSPQLIQFNDFAKMILKFEFYEFLSFGFC